MGKDVPAALLASSLRASLHSLARNELALRSVLNKANRFFHESSRDGMFATFFYTELDVWARRLIYINAGHLPALIVRASGDCEEFGFEGLADAIIRTREGRSSDI
jgi:sigma-B regulation protein RsbU (phosphoserine phosphatase)